jgi:hypothetical protein
VNISDHFISNILEEYEIYAKILPDGQKWVKDLLIKVMGND